MAEIIDIVGYILVTIFIVSLVVFFAVGTFGFFLPLALDIWGLRPGDMTCGTI